jgi:gliding motility-associated-like protein/uncharacterized repeat protein (TIGR01451 family)
MQRSGYIKGLYLIIFVFVTLLSKAQVTVQINSGNPNFPFPQFLSYDFEGSHSLGNLATTNAPGVVHAEMEKIMREAWQIEANRYEYTGESWQGVNYILSNIGCPYDCSEGAGYAMIAAAYMGDKTTFDGIWMREHDIRRVLHPNYRTGAIIRAGYQYGKNALAEPGGDAATDGDVDIALGLLMAWKQWGDNSGYTAANGTPISYKDEALGVIRGLVERENRGFMSGSVADCRSVSGNVGFDGYLKNGNTWLETTNFGSGDPLWCPEFAGPTQLHIDYAAPAYFYSFRNVMSAEALDPWEINQMYRAEASSDWIMGKLLDNPAGVPHAGWAAVNGSNVTFSSFNLGEDFRAAWRTILNYVWHGDPDYTWDPVTHTVQAGVPNSFEQLIGKRFSGFVKDQRQAPWGNPCKDLGGGPDLTYTGPPITSVQYDPNTGDELFPLPINWGMATSAPSTIAAQDYEVMGDMFRQCAIEWDITDAGDRYLTSKPVYFHGFFRLLGMLILSGNFQDPLVVKPIANIKIYRAVDKTYGATGDQFQFTLSYRNYGKLAATGVTIVETLPDDFDYVPGSASNGGSYNAGTHSITWNVGSVSGFSTAGGITPTQGIRTYSLKAKEEAEGRYCATATITATNSKSWTTNEYPNNVTEVMERNCIDIVKRALLIDKSVNYSRVQNNTEVKFKIDFENSSTAGWINGGRPNVFFSYAQGTYGANGDTRGIKIRLFHGAAEPYINYKNYRISAFLNDNSYTCVSGIGPCTAGWALRNTIYEGGAATGVTFTQESITPGQDARGKWNQRVIIQFANQIATTTPQLSAMYGTAARIHQGGTEPLRAVWDLYTSNYGSIDWSDDWSWDAAAQAPDGDKYFPVTNDWTDPSNLNIPVTSWHKDACEVATKTVDNVLIEEWDGYTWRRIYGNGPLPGRDVENVVVRDTLPLGLTWNGWIQQTTLGVTATYNPANRVITWTIPKLQVGQKGSLEYKAIATFTTPGVCPKADQTHINPAWIEGLGESKKRDTARVTVTCDDVILPPVPTTMTKTADKAAYVVGDPINYTIEYEQTHGAIIDASMSNAAEWNQYGGTWGFGTKISNTTTNGTGTMLVHKRAHGTNGTITGTLELAPFSIFSIALRQSGSTIASGSYVSFKVNPGAGDLEINVWNGTTPLFTTVQKFGYPGSPQNFKIVLNGNQLNLWVGSLTGAPLLTVTGITVKAGYIGFLNGSPANQETYNSHSVVSLHSEMDSAYDIIISDPVPAGITYGTSSNSGTNTAGTISWPVIAGPVLYGTVITRTWTGTVATCSATGKIVNNAYANMLGQATNSIAAQSIVTCSGTSVSCTPPATVTVSTTTPALCRGSALTIKGTATPANANYFYTWYRNGIAVTAASKTYADYVKAVTVAADSGTYTLRVEDGNTGTTTCFKENSIRVRIDTAAVAGIISASQEICLGTAAAALTGTASTGAIAVKNYKWQRSAVSGTGPWTDVAPFSTTATGLTIGSPTATTYYRRIDSSGVCANAVTNVDTIRVNNTPNVTSIQPILRDTLCIGENFNLSAAINLADSTGARASKNGGYYFTWQHYRNGALITTSGPLPYKNFLAATRAAVLTDSGMYYLIVQDGKLAKKCMDTISVRIVINQGIAKKAIIEKHQEICKGDAAAVLTEVAPAANYAGTIIAQQWYTTNDTTATPALTKISGATGVTYNPASPAVTQYYVRKDSVKFCPAVATNYIKVRVNNSVVADTIMPIENDTLCESIGSMFQLKGIVDSTGKASINGGYYFTWKHYRDGLLQETRGPVKYEDFPVTARAAVEADSGTYYLIIQDGAGATVCMDTLKTKVVVYKNCVVIPPACKKPVSVTAQLVGGNDTLCTGSALHLAKDIIDTLPAPQDGYYFSWRRINSQGSSVLYGPSLTYADLTIPAVAPADSGTYYLIVQDGLTAPAACTTTSAGIAIGVHTPIITPAVIAASDRICSGTVPAVFTETAAATGGSGTPYRHQWYVSTDSFKTVAGTSILTGSNLKTYQAPALTTTSYYIRIDSAGVCPKVSTNIITIQVDAPTVAGTVGRDTVVCAGSPVSEFRESTPASGGTAIYTYKWQESGDNTTFTDIAGATGSTYQSPDVFTRTYFRRIDSSGVCAGTPTNSIFVDVVNGVDPGQIAGPATTICYNTAPLTAFSNVAAASNGSGGTGSESYQWQKSTDNIFWTDISGETGLTFTENNLLTDTTYYRRRVGMGPGTCDTAYTSTIAVNVYDPLTPGVLSGDTTICSGKSIAVLEITPASGGGEPNSLTYEWIQSTDKGMNWSAAAGTNNQVSYTTPVLTDSIWYARIAASVCKTDTTNIVHVHVDSINTVSITMTDASTCIGSDVTFAPVFKGAGTDPVFEWFTSASSAGPWSPVTGAAAASYTVVNPQVTDNGTYYKVRLSSSFVCNSGTAENIVLLTVQDVIEPKVAISSSRAGTVCDTITSVTYTAVPVQGAGAVTTYQWYDGITNTPVPSETNQTYTPAAAPAAGQQVYVVMTTDLVCASPSTARSETLQLDIIPKPRPDIINNDTTICTPYEVRLKIKGNTGGTLQWYKDGAVIPGATTTQYIVPVSDFPGAEYVLVEDNGACSSSDTVEVIMWESPTANAGTDIYAVEGETISLNGSVSSNATNYVWIPAASLSDAYVLQPSLTVPAFTTVYTLVAYNNGNVCSGSDAVTVIVEKKIKVPNVITVNGDGVNDTWDIENIQNFPDAEILIYNRWGNLVWKSAGYPKQWDATNYRNGEVLPDGTYFYIIDLHTERVKETFSGYIQVVK